MANKKVSQLVSKPSVLVTDLFPIADPTTGQLFKTTISDLGTAIGSGVSSVNTLVGAVVLDTDDIQELASPTNRWFTDTRARAALSASSPLAYNSGTGVFSIPQANGSTNGFLSSADWTTFNAKQTALNGTGFVKISGTTISYDNSTYLTTSAAASTYLALAGGTLTGALNGTSATFTGDVTLSATNPRLYFTDTDNNPDYFISNTDGTFTVYDVTNSTSRFTIGSTGNGTFGGNLTVGQIIRSGGTSSQFLKADGSVDSSTYAKRSGLTDGYLPAWSSSLLGGSLTDSFISYASNITYVAGMGLSTLNGLDIEGNYGAGGGGLKIRSYDETTGNAYIDFANTGGRMYLGLNRSTAGGLMTNATAYATVLTTGLGTTNLEFGTNATKRMTIDGTTGAVTLTSALSGTTITTTGNNIFNNSGGRAIDAVSTGVLFAQTGGTHNIIFGDGNVRYYSLFTPSGAASMSIRNFSTSTDLLTIASTGAATFSSSVTATTGLTVGSLGSGSDAVITLANNASGSPRSIYYKASTATINFTQTGGADLMTLTNGGNLGIGTTAPTTYSLAGRHLEVNDAGGGYAFIHNNTTNVKSFFAADNADGSAGMYTFSNHFLKFGTNNIERMRIKSNGIINFSNVPTSSAGLSTGDIYKTVAGVLMIV